MWIKGYRVTPRSAVNLFLGFSEKLFSTRWLNLFKTLYVNFRLFPFHVAVRLPVFVYGRLRVISLLGRAEVRGTIRPGMIRFGIPPPEEFVGYTSSILANQGTILFNGPCVFFNGFCIRVCRDKTLEVGDRVTCSSNVSIYALDDIKIGNQTRIAFNSLLMSSDMHYSIDTKTREVHGNSAPIVIGNNNWITSHVKVMKGTVTPPWTIVTSGSFLNKDYTDSVPPESVIGGVPAKLIKQGQRRVFSLNSEKMLREYFAGQSAGKFVLGEGENMDLFSER